MFVTASNFDTPPYNLPNLDKVVNTFSDYVNALEEEALVKLLGRQLYKSFIAGLEDLPGIDDEYSDSSTYADGDQVYSGSDIWESLVDNNTGQPLVEGANWTLIEEGNKWLKLRDGSEYDYASKTWKYKGVVHLLVPFIVSRWIRDNADAFTGSAVVVPNNENSQIISPALRICRAYNDYAERFGVVRGNAYLKSSYEAGYSSHYAGCFSTEDTLYGFLTANRADYEVDGLVWCFESPDLMDIAGI